MEPVIETYVQQIARIAPSDDERGDPERVVASLGGRAHRSGDQSWTVALPGPAFESATVEAEVDGEERTVRITFAPRVEGARLDALSGEPAQWESSVALPDSGEVTLIRHWFDLPSKLSVSCSAVVQDDADPAASAIDEITCMVTRL